MPTFATTLAAAATATQAKLLVAAAAATDGDFYVQVDEEFILVERGGNVTRRFPNTNTTRIEWQVKRGQLGSVKAAHLNAADVTEVVPGVGTADPVVPPGTGGGGGVTVDNQTDPPAAVTSIVAPNAVIVGDEATLPSKDFYAQDADPGAVGAGSVWRDTSGTPYNWYERNAANDGWDAFADITATSTGSNTALAVATVTASGTGDAYADRIVEAVGGAAYAPTNVTAGGAVSQADAGTTVEAVGGAASASTAVSTGGAGNAVADTTVTSVDGFARASKIVTATGDGAAAADTTVTADDGVATAITSATTTTGSADSGVMAVRGATVASLRVAVSGAGVASIIALGLPTADPVVAGALWNDTGTLKVSAG